MTTSALEKLSGPPVEDTTLRADLGDLNLDPLKKGLPTVDVIDRVLDAGLTLTIDGASTLTLTLDNYDREVSRADMFRGAQRHQKVGARNQTRYALPAIDLVLTNWPFRLVGFQKQGDTATLTFEDRAISLLRRHTSPLKASRAHITRAEFVMKMLDEVQAYRGIPRYIPEIHVKQPIAAPSPSDRKRLRAGAHPGFSPKFHPTVKGTRADSAQLHNIEVVLNTGEQMGAVHVVLVAAIETITQESSAQTGATNGDHVGLFQQSRAAGWPATRDPEKDSRAFFAKAITYAQAHGDATAADIALGVQAPGGSPSQYGQWQAEAEATVTEYKGGATDFTPSRTYYQTYEFTRGQPGGPKGEDSWDAITRLATEVQWRRFMRWNGHDMALWFISDPKLLSMAPLAEVSEDDDGIETIDYQLDESSKFVDRVTVETFTTGWVASPGTIVVVADDCPADGRWLVQTVERKSLLRPEMTITLVPAVRPLPEPRPQLVTTSAGSAGPGEVALTGPLVDTAVGKAYAEAVRVDARHYPYAWGGGHANFSGPYDCSGFVSACLHAAGLLDTPLTTVGLIAWGQAGKGKHLTVWVKETGDARLSHTVLEFDLPGRGTQWFEAGGGGGTTGRRTSIPTAGFSPRHWPGV